MNPTGRGRGRGPGERTWRPLRRSASLCALGVAVVAGGCATKNDLKQLRDEVVEMQVRQDSLFRLLQEQNASILDTLRTSGDLVMRVRGELGYQLQQMEQQLIQIQELTGQSQRRLAELRQQWERRAEQFASAPLPAAGPAEAADTDVETLYALGRQKLQEGAAVTARSAFEQIVSGFPTHPRAPEAQYQIAETYVAEGEFDRALEEFERVIELFPNSPRAAQALYRAGVVSEERGNISDARRYFNRVVSGYPRSEEARLAEDRLRSLQGR
ncbi:MAG TPA: tetratricopeptide repeat protein [Longimicrobiales bacterium]